MLARYTVMNYEMQVFSSHRTEVLRDKLLAARMLTLTCRPPGRVGLVLVIARDLENPAQASCIIGIQNPGLVFFFRTDSGPDFFTKSFFVFLRNSLLKYLPC